MSALPLKAGMCSEVVHVRFGPIVDICSLNDYIHALQKFVGNAQAQRLRSLEVDDQLVLGGLLNRYVLRSFALKNSLHEFCTVPNSSGAIGPEGHQASNICKHA